MEVPGSRQRVDQVPQRSSNPDFGLLVRRIYAFIKVTHHEFQVNDDFTQSTPPIITRTATRLASVIQPALPDAHVLDRILSHAQEWGRKTRETLARHYEKVSTDLHYDLPSISTIDWRMAFRIATRWAKKNLPRITDEVISYAEDRIEAAAGEDDTQESTPNPPIEEDEDPPPIQTPSQQSERDDRAEVKADAGAVQCTWAKEGHKPGPKMAAARTATTEGQEGSKKQLQPGGFYLQSLMGSMSGKPKSLDPDKDEQKTPRRRRSNRGEDSGFVEDLEATNQALSPSMEADLGAQKRAHSALSTIPAEAETDSQTFLHPFGTGVTAPPNRGTISQGPSRRKTDNQCLLTY